MTALPDFVWKLVADYDGPVGGDAAYALARYRVDRKWKRLVRDPEHQDWSFHSRSTAELMLKAEAAGEAYRFWSEPMHTAPQVIDLSVTELHELKGLER